MKKNSIPATEKNVAVDWEARPWPGGILAQKQGDGCDVDSSSDGPLITVNVSHGSVKHQILVPAHSTFGDLKNHLVQKTGLAPEDQRLYFRGKENDDEEQLHAAGVKNRSKILLLENPASVERKLEEIKMSEEISKALEEVATVRREVDKLSEKVDALQAAVTNGTKVAEKEFVVLAELLMRQLLKLDGIEADGEAKLQRKTEVRRIQNFVEVVDNLKERNSNPLSNGGMAVSVSTGWETFDSPASPASSTKMTRDWERFD